MKKLALLLFLLMLSPISVHGNDMDDSLYLLEQGTERYFDVSANLMGFPYVGIWSIAAERVIDTVILDDNEWAVVVWETTHIDYPNAVIVRDTTLLRLQDGKLIEHYENEEPDLLFDYNFKRDSSLIKHFTGIDPDFPTSHFLDHYYYGDEEPNDLFFSDTTVTFPNEQSYRVFWGNPDIDHLSISAETFVDSVLVEHDAFPDLLVPLDESFISPTPFYYIEGIGTLGTVGNHRNLFPMSGIITPAGDTLGHTMSHIFKAPEVVSQVYPEHEATEVNKDDSGKIEFVWEESLKSEHYELQVSSSPEFETLIVSEPEIDDTL